MPDDKQTQTPIGYKTIEGDFNYYLLTGYEKTIHPLNNDLIQAYESMIFSFVRTLSLCHSDTVEHTLRVTHLTVAMGKLCNFPEGELLYLRWGAMLHDIGKVAIPDQILLKPGPLTDSEWKIMQMHPTHAYLIFSPIDCLGPALDIPYCHHEKWDGTGYPRRLAGEEIPLSARIFSIIDVWDALTSDRPYRQAWSEVEALHYIYENAGSHFDPKLVNLFFENYYETIRPIESAN